MRRHSRWVFSGRRCEIVVSLRFCPACGGFAKCSLSPSRDAVKWEAHVQGEGDGSLSPPLSLESRFLMTEMGTSCSKGTQKAEISTFKTEGESEGLFLPHMLLFNHLKGPKLTSEHIHSLYK